MNAFTKVYPKLAERTPVYAQLRNCIDLAVAAAFIQNQDYYGLAKWTPEVFPERGQIRGRNAQPAASRSSRR